MNLKLLRPALFGAALLAAGPAAAQSVTVTGQNGATYQSTRDCARAEGTATCSKSAVLTGANGQEATRSRQRVTSGGSSATTISSTGPGGETRSRTRLLTITR